MAKMKVCGETILDACFIWDTVPMEWPITTTSGRPLRSICSLRKSALCSTWSSSAWSCMRAQCLSAKRYNSWDWLEGIQRLVSAVPARRSRSHARAAKPQRALCDRQKRHAALAWKECSTQQRLGCLEWSSLAATGFWLLKTQRWALTLMLRMRGMKRGPFLLSACAVTSSNARPYSSEADLAEKAGKECGWTRLAVLRRELAAWLASSLSRICLPCWSD